jgi:vitamin B12 transporter
MGTSAAAQTALELPGIVVEGATLEAPRSTPKRKPAAAAPSAPTGTPEGQVQVAAEGVVEAEAASDQAAGVPAAHLGTAVTVVTGEDLQRQQVRHAADALRSLPGVSVARFGSPAGLSEVRIRGAEANHTLVLIDGIEANAGSDGSFDFSDLLTEDIERIEVIRGPQSALYGSNAIGGVVNIITRSGKGPLSVVARSEVGTFATRGAAARASGGNDRVWGAVSVQHQGSEGHNLAPEGPLGEEDGYRLTSFSAKAGAMLAENIQLDVTIRHSDKKMDRDDETGGNTRDGWVILSDSLSHYSSSVLLMGANLRWDMLDGNLTHLFKASRNLTHRDDVLVSDFGIFPAYTTDDAYGISYQSTYRFQTPAIGVKHAITGLIDQERETFENESGGTVMAARKRTGYAAEWRGDFFERVYLSAGLRHDDYDRFEGFTTWRTGISVPIPELNVRPHASAGTGVKVPTMFEQFGQTPFFEPNPDLRPEKSKGWDAGIEFTAWQGRAILDITYFNSDLIDRIDTIFGPVSTAINIPGKSTREGVEVSGAIQITTDLRFGFAYTYMDTQGSDGQREIRRPTHSARGDLTYIFHEGRGQLQLMAVYQGEADDRVLSPDFLTEGRIVLDDYWLVTAAASYKLNPGLEIYGRVENLFDEDYEEIFGYQTAGIAAYAGLRWTFDYERPGNGLSMK